MARELTSVFSEFGLGKTVFVTLQDSASISLTVSCYLDYVRSRFSIATRLQGEFVGLVPAERLAFCSLVMPSCPVASFLCARRADAG